MDSMEQSIPVRGEGSFSFRVPGLIKRLVKDERRLLRELFDVLHSGRTHNPVVAWQVASLKDDIAFYGEEIQIRGRGN